MLYRWFRWYVFPRRRYSTRCQYCNVPTGVTMHAWATKDVCATCVARFNTWTPDDPEYIVETGDVGA